MVRNHNSSNVQRITENKSSKNHSVRSDLTLNNLKALRDADISACNADKLVDLSDVKVKRKLPLNRRADDFIAQVGNPYLFRVDDVVVKIEFGDGKDFSEMLTDVIIAG